MAILALVFAILFWPLGIIFGHVARHRNRQTGERGDGLALAGLIIGYAWGAGVVVVIIFAVALSGTSSLLGGPGFNNLAALQRSVSQQVNANLRNPSKPSYSPGTSVSSTLCVHNSGTQYTCLVNLSNGLSDSISITVSSDGSRWVSNG